MGHGSTPSDPWRMWPINLRGPIWSMTLCQLAAVKFIENAVRNANRRSKIRAWQWRGGGWWWRIELIRNTKSMRKLVSQVQRCGIPERAVCDLETGVNWWLEMSDQCGWSSGSRRMDSDEVTQGNFYRFVLFAAATVSNSVADFRSTSP